MLPAVNTEENPLRIKVTAMIAILIAVAETQTAARTVNTAISITATQISEDDTGPCKMPGFAYDEFCPSGSNNCICRKFAGTVRGGLIGKGPLQISITVDNDAATSTPGCVPFFAGAEGTTQRVSQSINAVGVICQSMQRNRKNPVSGGAGLIPSGQSGWGTLSGSLDEDRSPAFLKIQLRARVTF